jgi:hypothetical protein
MTHTDDAMRPSGLDETVHCPASVVGNPFGPATLVTEVPADPAGGANVTCGTVVTVNGFVAKIDGFDPSVTLMLKAPSGAVWDTAKLPVTTPVDEIEHVGAGLLARIGAPVTSDI